MSDEEEREALISRMQSAGTLSEMDTAIEEARGWMRGHPGDERVAAAMQRLEERKACREDPERAPNRLSIAAFAVSALVIWGAVFTLTGNWPLSIAAGVLLGAEIAWWTWESALALVENTRRNRRGG